MCACVCVVVVELLIVSDSLQPHGRQHANSSVLHYLPDFSHTDVH